ncbi:MAG: RNA-binding S4 domain-containing protein [Ideonella sp.]|jgi:ribosome-associated heat shock protein Hsp15|nr:RNA-binding S4 domain-containing protein [Ideonella sp.]
MPADPRRSSPPDTPRSEGQRLDKWLWAARFFKTRSIAVEEIERGRVRVNDAECKPGRELRLGDRVWIRQGPVQRTVLVMAFDAKRGPASIAQTLYAETEDSRRAREAEAERRRTAPEPALEQARGRPTKRDRRQLAEWTRWSAGLPEDGGPRR